MTTTITKVVLPELGEGIKNATIACWHIRVGEPVTEGDDVVELVTDKATFNVPAPRSGIIKQILVDEGKEALVGSTLAIIE